MLDKIRLVLRTGVHLRSTQIIHQIYYRIRGKLYVHRQFGNLKNYKTPELRLRFFEFSWVPASTQIHLVDDELRFVFINLEKSFPGKRVDWNDEGHGKLWNYNLNYFDFLFDQKLSKDQGLELIRDYGAQLGELKGGLEPYPISLRMINWVKFLSIHEIKDDEIDQFIYRQYQILKKNLEYHLLANHLLENAFSLIFGAYYFRDDKFYDMASRLLRNELNEQLTADGAHYERSPMYHHTILFRLLDTINLVSNNPWKGDLLGFLQHKASQMIGWMNAMDFGNGEMPMVKDATAGIAPSTATLQDYAAKLGFDNLSNQNTLADSGYRKISCGNLTMLVDVGNISPSYQPGHAHADELNFLLYDKGVPLIVDTGISTYEKNARRQLERSTAAHNCVYLESHDSSEVWGGFRVGRRAKVKILKEAEFRLQASHDGYKSQGLIVERTFEADGEAMVITSKVNSSTSTKVLQYLHFHPDCVLSLKEDGIQVGNFCVSFYGFEEFSTEKYMFATGFNQLVEAERIVLSSMSENTITFRNVN